MHITEVDEFYRDIFYSEDKAIIPLIASVILGVHVDVEKIWLMLVAGSSGGKSELVNMTLGSPNVHAISELSENALLSGMPDKKGEQPKSFLHQLGDRGTIAMKDFTSMLSQNPQTKERILGQFREVYDGHLERKVGNGKELVWKGHVNLLAGVTEAIYNPGEGALDKGMRFLVYLIEQPDSIEGRIKMTERALENLPYIKERRQMLEDKFTAYIEEMMFKLPDTLPPIKDKALRTELIELAEFASKAMSTTYRNYRGQMELDHSHTLPMRMSQQLFSLYQMFQMMFGEDDVPEYMVDALYKIALDSIPKTRRVILQMLTEHQSVEAFSVADELGYSQDVVASWLQDLAVLRVINRYKVGERERYKLPDNYRKMFSRVRKIKMTDDELVRDDGIMDEDSLARSF